MATGKVTISSINKLQGWLWDTQCVGFGARRQTGGLFYYVRYRHNGKQTVHSIGRHGSAWTPETARARARQLLGTVALGTDPFAQPLSAEGFAHEVTRYLERRRAANNRCLVKGPEIIARAMRSGGSCRILFRRNRRLLS